MTNIDDFLKEVPTENMVQVSETQLHKYALRLKEWEELTISHRNTIRDLQEIIEGLNELNNAQSLQLAERECRIIDLGI